MKNLLIFCLLALSSFSLRAQDKVKLTKEETINYLNKKLIECEGHYRTPDASAFTNGKSQIMHYTYLRFAIDGDKVKLTIESSNYFEKKSNSDYFNRFTTQSFNPSQILSITESTTNKNEPVGIILIKLIANSCNATKNVYWYKFQDDYGNGTNYGNHDGTSSSSTNEVGFVYLSSDPSNFNKIKKAFEYLRDLYKAEDDPFGE